MRKLQESIVVCNFVLTLGVLVVFPVVNLVWIHSSHLSHPTPLCQTPSDLIFWIKRILCKPRGSEGSLPTQSIENIQGLYQHTIEFKGDKEALPPCFCLSQLSIDVFFSLNVIFFIWLRLLGVFLKSQKNKKRL